MLDAGSRMVDGEGVWRWCGYFVNQNKANLKSQQGVLIVDQMVSRELAQRLTFDACEL